MSTQYYPLYKNNSNNIKVELDLTNYTTKDVDVSSSVPDDLAKLTNIVKNETVKKTDFSSDDYVKKNKFSADTNALDNKIDKVDKKIPDVSNLATKSSVTKLIRDLNDRIDKIKIKDYAKKISLSGYMPTSTFNTKSTELENKIKDADIIAKSAVTKANPIKSDLTDFAKKTDVATDITAIKNDYVTNAGLTSRLNDLKSQHIATEVTAIDNKTKKNASDILALESKLQQKEDTINENERGNSFARGLFYYLQQSHLVYECKIDSFNFTNKKISKRKSTGVFSMKGIKDRKTNLPELRNDRKMYVYLQGNYLNKIVQ